MDSSKPDVDFKEYEWMGEVDLERFDEECQDTFLQEEIMLCDLEDIFEQEEASSFVYYCTESAGSFDSSSDEDYMGYNEDVEQDDQGTEDAEWSLNPEAATFVPQSITSRLPSA